VFALGLCALFAAAASAGEWTHWRGPNHNGTAEDTGLPSTWSKDGTNLLWRADFTSRSTPMVFDGRVCATGRVGEEIHRQEVAACWDAETGEKLWETQWPIYLTSVPWTRVSWGDPAADSETGYLFVQGVNGRFVALDREGNIAWQWIMGEDLGRFSGYGGRTNSPVVDEDRVIVHSISSMWGPHKPAGDRYIAFDKRTGEIQWLTNRNGPPAKDLNTYSTPVVAVIGGQRLLITGGADGWIRALNSRTGADVWKFRLSQRGLNASPIVDGDTVYVSHSEENLDSGIMGRLVAIDGTGRGDVTKTHELWRVDELLAGYASPTIHDGVLYVPDNSANVHAIDAKTGKKLWHHNYGTVGKGSPVWADGKLFATEVNGNLAIIEPGTAEGKTLGNEHLEVAGGRYAELYGSVAVAYGRFYFTTEEGVYCVGDQNKPFNAEPGTPRKMAEKPAVADGPGSLLLVVPGVAVARSSDTLKFRAQVFDDLGNRMAETTDATWSLNGLPGKISTDGTVRFDPAAVEGTQVGTVTARIGDLEATAHLRIAGPLPWDEDFENIEIGKAPPSWLGLGKGAKVKDLDGNKVIAQPKAARGAPRATLLLGPASLSAYTVQADIRGNAVGRRKTDLGVVNSGYTVELMGNHQRIQVSSWSSERRMAQIFPYAWEMGVWYTIKSRVDIEGEGENAKAIIRGKIWRSNAEEPADWTVTVEDPHPIRHGSPGLYTYAPVESYFDNVHITAN
jgi:outer membrane protein assembly factor BamB